LKQAVRSAWDCWESERLPELRECVETIRALFESHVGEEEHELFTIAERTLGQAQLVELTAQAREIQKGSPARNYATSLRSRAARSPSAVSGERERVSR
jgi:hypothetical protein